MNSKNRNLILIVLILLMAALAACAPVNNSVEQQVPGESKPAVAEVDAGAEESENTEENADITIDQDIKILKSDITEKAKFYPYKSGDTYMEVLAVKASDGSIRTALNTCQVCFNSGQGYYKQEGNKLVCQNCGNVFGVDDVEVVRGGCNPVPVMKDNKTDDGEYITVKRDFLAANKDLFSDWKR